MQIFALDKDKNHLLAEEALSGVDYYCPECGERLRLRAGTQRQHHFFHLEKNKLCRQNNKSLNHINLQYHIFQKLSKRKYKVGLEQYFPNIKRIADVCCPELKLIFEVQCSNITPQEIFERNLDYAKEGFNVVWILNDNKLYNKKGLTAAEKYLENLMHYYSNIDHDGNVNIYDQFEVVYEQRRYYRFYRHNIDISQVKKFDSMIHNKSIGSRSKNWPFYFNNDLYDYLSKRSSSPLFKIFQREENKLKQHLLSCKIKSYRKIFARLYRGLFNFLLEGI